MGHLQVFDYCHKRIRILQSGSETWFVLKDVCDALGLSNPSMVASRLEDDEVTKFDLGGLSGESNIISEAGLYSVILRSDKYESRPFKRWVTHEVLPSIRTHGAYLTTTTIEGVMNDPDSWIVVLNALKGEREQRKILQAMIDGDKQKMDSGDAVGESGALIGIGDLAKRLSQTEVDMDEARLYEWLRENRYLIKSKGVNYNSPTQRSMNMGILALEEKVFTYGVGLVSNTKTTKVTGKGQLYFKNLFLGEGASFEMAILQTE